MTCLCFVRICKSFKFSSRWWTWCASSCSAPISVLYAFAQVPFLLNFSNILAMSSWGPGPKYSLATLWAEPEWKRSVFIGCSFFRRTRIATVWQYRLSSKRVLAMFWIVTGIQLPKSLLTEECLPPCHYCTFHGAQVMLDQSRNAEVSACSSRPHS